MTSTVTSDLPGMRLAANCDDVAFAVTVSTEGRFRVVRVVGEMDIAARGPLLGACLAGRPDGVIVDMAQLTFLDCSGYGALVATRQALEERGGSLTLRNFTGQPARLLALLEPAG